jgi:hypothetical protein
MGKAAGENAAASLGYGKPATRTLPYVVDMRILDAGDTGLLLASWGNSSLHNAAGQLPGRTAHYLKAAVERLLVWQLRTGRMGLL